MIIDNTLRTSKIKMAFVISFFAFLVTLIYSFATGYQNNYVLLGVSLLFLLIYFFLLILKLHYFHLNTNKQKMLIRFYAAHPLFRKFKAFEIQKRNYAGYEIKKSIFGLRNEILFLVKTKKGIVKYPAVSISALNKKERELLIKTLEKLNN